MQETGPPGRTCERARPLVGAGPDPAGLSCYRRGVDAILVHGLAKRYGDLHAVTGIDLAVHPGETFGILGPNGAGKTTTLEMIEGLTRPDAGTVEILGEPVWPDPRSVQRRIGVQLQHTALFDNLDAGELLALFCDLYAVPRDAARIAGLLETVGLEQKSGALAKELSGGQQQRLAIALALVHEPEIVFLDEPTTGLDPQARRNLWDVIRAIASEGRTVVITTHYLEEAEELCDRTAIMDAGSVIALDSPRMLINELGPASRVTFAADGLGKDELERLPSVTSVADHDDGTIDLVSESPQRTLVGLVGLAEERHVELRDLAVRRPSLEDVFLSLTGREFRE
jgi:ABC-2 type transport system ATP-binding protein